MVSLSWCHSSGAEGRFLIPQSLPGAEAQHQHSCLVQGYWHTAQVPGLGSCPEAFCQLEIDVECDLLIRGPGKIGSRLPKLSHGLFSGPLEMSLVLRACVEPASNACHSCKANKEISACNLLFSFSFHYIKGILMISALFWENWRKIWWDVKSRRVHTAEHSSAVSPSLCLISELDLTGVKSLACCYWPFDTQGKTCLVVIKTLEHTWE